jgi:subtilase family serine protease
MQKVKVLKHETFSLSEQYISFGEQFVKDLTASYSCPRNKSVEKFFRYNAFNSCLQGITQTHYIATTIEGESIFTGFFTLANKVVTVKHGNVTSTFFNKIRKFGYYDELTDSVTVSVPLIAQLGKNFNRNYNNLITGTELLEIACEKVREAQDIIGGRAVYLECEAVPKLTGFYIDNGFVAFGSRAPGEGDDGDLIQMIRYQR